MYNKFNIKYLEKIFSLAKKKIMTLFFRKIIRFKRRY